MQTIIDLIQSNKEIKSASFCLMTEQNTFEYFQGRSGPEQNQEVSRATKSVIFSISKNILSYLVLHVLNENQIDLDSPISQHFSQFQGHGKEKLSFRQLLSHQGRFPSLPSNFKMFDYENSIQQICNLIPDEKIKTFAYHPLTSGYILGKAIELIAHQDLPEILTKFLGEFEFSYGYPSDAIKDYLKHHYVPPSSSTINGIDRRAMVEIFNEEKNFLVPSAGIISSAYNLCLFGKKLLTELNFKKFLQPALEPQISGLDQTFNIQASWGLFFMLSKDSHLYGKKAPLTLAGHGGSTAHLFWINLEKKYVACFLSDSHLSLPRSQKRDEKMVQLVEAFTDGKV